MPRREVEGDDLMSSALARDILDLTLEHLVLVSLSMAIAAAIAIPAGILLTRSEERRVGKECIPPCRSRWSPSH